MVIFIKPKNKPGVVYTQYNGFIPGDEILRLNNEAFGVIVSEENKGIVQWPIFGEESKYKKKIIQLWE